MDEDKSRIALLVFITGLVALAGQNNIFSYKQDPAYVSNYSAVFHSDFVLEETFTYRINDPGKHFLYRYWKTYLSTVAMNNTHVQILDLTTPTESVGYIKDYQGNVKLYNGFDNSVHQSIEDNAYNNEAGAYSIEGYAPGDYTVKYWFKIFPPLEIDDEFIHLNLMLADTHIHYENVKIVIEDNGQIKAVYMHPPTLKKIKERNTWVFTGEIPEDMLLEFELLLMRNYEDQIAGIYNIVEGVENLTIIANNLITGEYLMASTILWLSKLSGYFMPLLFFIIWYIYGKEKEYTVPRYLSSIPVKLRKPWIVNLVFKKSVSDLDEDAVYGTLIDLHLRNKIKIEQSENISIRIISDTGLDTYENELMKFLKGVSFDNLVTLENIEKMAEEAKTDFNTRAKVIELKYSYIRLKSGTNNTLAAEYTVDGRSRLVLPATYSILLIFTAFIGYILSFSSEPLLIKALGYSVIPLIQIIVALLFPSTLFGYWKDHYYKEKLEWDAFKRNLSDFSRMEHYEIEDLNMWGKWLVYGTSLGVGKQVSEHLRKLEVPIDIPMNFPEYNILFRPIIISNYSTPKSSISSSSGFSTSSRRSGGGFGGGRGFGGGGGGVR